MGDFKSKLPDLKELGSMSEKIFKSLKSSVTEIIEDYKKKRETAPEATPAKTEKESEKKAAPAPEATEEEIKAENKEAETQAKKENEEPDAKS